MKRIALDMDGVIADTYKQLFDWDEKEFGTRRTWEFAMGKPEGDVFPSIRRYVYTEGFFGSAAVMEGCQKVVEELNRKYDLFIVSAATEFPQCLSEKQKWLGEHFPYITWQQMVFCGSKKIISADIMIDDHYKNLDFFTGELSILFDQPHNSKSPDGRHKRVKNWEELGRLLL